MQIRTEEYRPTVGQIEKWAAGEEPSPDIEELARMAKAVGDRRTAAARQASDESKVLEQLIPLLFRRGFTRITEIHKLTGVHNNYIYKYLDKAGIPRGTTRAEAMRKQLAKKTEGGTQPD